MSKAKPCKQCGKERPALAITHRDPFCSNSCCRKAHGLAPPPGKQDED